MKLFSKFQSCPLKGIFEGMTDWHSHILPGVDDGVKTTADSLLILDKYENAGVRNVILTPHIMVDIPNETEKLKERFEDLKKAYQGRVKLYLAAENMIDNLFYSRLEKKDLLTLPGNRLLVETSYFNPPVDLYCTLMDIKKAGYIPVLAHPERYEYMDMHQYESLFDADIEFQLNIPSLAGFYGRGVQERAVWLLKEEFYTMCGTDLHRKSQLTSLLGASIRRPCLEKFSESVLEISNKLL